MDSSQWGYIANGGIGIIPVKQTSHATYFLVGYLDIDVKHIDPLGLKYSSFILHY